MIIQENLIYKASLYLACGVAILFVAILWYKYQPKNNVVIKYDSLYILQNSVIIDKNITLYNNTDSNIIAINILIKGGSFIDPADKIGLANLFAKTLEKGVGGLNYDNFNEYLLDNSLVFNVSASRDYIEINIKGLIENQKALFNLVNMLLVQPNLSNLELDLAKKDVLSVLVSNSNNGLFLLSSKMLQVLYNKHYYPTVGEALFVNKITSTDLVKFKQNIFNQQNIYIAISGNINEEISLKFLQPILKQLPYNNNLDLQNLQQVILPNIYNNNINIYKQNLQQSQALIVFNAPPVTNINNIYKLHILNLYLGGMPDSYLFNEIRNKKGLVYSINSAIYKDLHTSYWYVYLAASENNIDLAITETITAITSILNGNFTTKDLKTAYKWYLLNNISNYNTNLSIATYLNQLQFNNITYNDYQIINYELDTLIKEDIKEILNTIDIDKFIILKTISGK